jgi:hypothetical protein
VAVPRSGPDVSDNGRVIARLVRFGTGVLVVLAAPALVACGSDGPPPRPPESQAPVAGAAVEPRADLARRVAAAKDRRFTAAYAWTGAGDRRTVTVTLAADGTWRVDVPGGAQGGRATVSMVGRAEGVYQCSGTGCVRVARAAGTVPASVDPKVHHPFTDWPTVLADPNAALSVTAAAQLPGTAGACFSGEPTTVAIAAPIDPGIFCYADDGMPTGFKILAGTLVLEGAAGAAPPTVELAGAVSNSAPLGTAPPSPTPSTRRRRRTAIDAPPSTRRRRRTAADAPPSRDRGVRRPSEGEAVA